jgi:hypothetical protein
MDDLLDSTASQVFRVPKLPTPTTSVGTKRVKVEANLVNSLPAAWLPLPMLSRFSLAEVVESGAVHVGLPPPPLLLKGFMPERVLLEELVAQKPVAAALGVSDQSAMVVLALLLSSASQAALVLVTATCPQSRMHPSLFRTSRWSTLSGGGYRTVPSKPALNSHL